MTKKSHTTLLKWLILIALLAYTVVMAVWAIDCHASEKCVGIEVVIDSHSFMGDTITRKGVISELARFDSKLIGKPLSSINTRAIERFLISFSNFETVECVTTSGGKLRIFVTPVVPELRVFDGDQSYYINKDGKHIEANAKFYCDVPVVSGHFTDKFPASALLPLTRRIARDSIFRNLIMMVKADSPNDIILIPRVAGHVINIGNPDNIDTKLHNILLAYQEILPYRGWRLYDTISVKFAGRIIASRRNKILQNHTPEFEQSVDFDEESANLISEGTELAAQDMNNAVNNSKKSKPLLSPGNQTDRNSSPPDKTDSPQKSPDTKNADSSKKSQTGQT